MQEVFDQGGSFLFVLGKRMAKEFAKGFYNSRRWRRCRAAYIEKRRAADGGLCERCHKHIGVIVHHIRELAPANIDDPDISLAESNLMLECKECHDREGEHFNDARGDKKLLVFFNERGEPIPKPNSPPD